MRLVEHIERRALTTLSPYAHNARIHSAEQVAQIAQSIKTFGFNNPILIDGEGGIIAGHGRYAAALKLGMDAAPVIVLDHLSDRERRAYIIADNKLAENATWDDAVLAAELAALNEEEFDLSILGFDDKALEKLLAEDEPEVPEDDGLAPQFERLKELQAKWGTARGQLWEFGNLKHRLVCGDCTDAGDVAALMDGRKAQLCFTSPPYASQRNYMAPIEDWNALMLGMSRNLPMAKDGQVLVNLGLVHNEGEWSDYFWQWIEAMRHMSWRRFGFYVWDQGPGLPGVWAGRFAPSHEFVFHFNRESRLPNKIVDCVSAGRVIHSTGMRNAAGVAQMKTGAGKLVNETKIPDSIIAVMRHMARGIEMDHPAVFPVALAAFMVEAWTNRNELCYEPFAGSGTQFLAAERLRRTCYGCEIAPEYCAVILERMTEAGMTPHRIDPSGS
jgi:DNA modification methylase